jgi:hypothetical protein
MKLKSIMSRDFLPYGTVLTGYDTAKLIRALEKHTEKPPDRVIYGTSKPKLEDL